MNKLFPQPLLSLTLLIIWLLVQMSFSIGNIIMGAILGFVVPLLTAKFWPDSPAIKSYPKLFKYILVFLYDVLVANIQVAAWILGPQDKLRPRWLYMPLEVQDPFSITLLAATISLTPGTVSAHISADRKLLVIHCLNSPDDEATVQGMKDRYEKPILEIFG